MPASSSVKSKRRGELLDLIGPDGREPINLRPRNEWRNEAQHLPSKNEDRKNDVELKLP